MPFAVLVIACYTALLLPALWRVRFDFSAFIVAGDRFVDRLLVPTPIMIRHDAAGYDGQFYYRLALVPFSRDHTAFGVTFDVPAWRMRRIIYPLLVHAVTWGRAAAVPAAMLAVNICGLGVIAATAIRLARRLDLARWYPLAMVAWPGFLVTLVHDTTEITAAAMLILAIYCYVAERNWRYFLFGALASLTRETSLLALLGILVLEFALAVRRGPLPSQWRRLAPFILAPVPYLLWRAATALYLGPVSHAAVAHPNLGWPLQGALLMLAHTVAPLWSATVLRGQQMRVVCFVLAGALAILVFCAAVGARALAALRDPTMAKLAAPFLPVLALMSLLTANGPWIDPNAYFRAFTECYVIGLPLYAWRPMPRAASAAIFCGGVLSWAALWVHASAHAP